MKKSGIQNIVCNLFAILIISLIPINLSFASIHEVNVSNTKFTPKNITINAGDTVRWTNTLGTHNVNGNKSSFPNNPESFGNDVGEGWVYIFMFTVPGKYDYECTPHRNFGMVGTVTVEATNEVSELQNSDNGIISVYPNPTSDFITICLSSSNSNNGSEIIITDINGRETEKYSVANSSSIVLDTRNYAEGTYYISVITNGSQYYRGMFIVR